jgi:hypothetical protein
MPGHIGQRTPRNIDYRNAPLSVARVERDGASTQADANFVGEGHIQERPEWKLSAKNGFGMSLCASI